MRRYPVTVWNGDGASDRLHVEAPNGIFACNRAGRWVDKQYGRPGERTIKFDEPEGVPGSGDLRWGGLRSRLSRPAVDVGSLPLPDLPDDETSGDGAEALENRLGVSLPPDYEKSLGDRERGVGDADLLSPAEVYWLDVAEPDRYLAFAVTVGGDVFAFDTAEDWKVVLAGHDPLTLTDSARSYTEWLHQQGDL